MSLPYVELITLLASDVSYNDRSTVDPYWYEHTQQDDDVTPLRVWSGLNQAPGSENVKWMSILVAWPTDQRYDNFKARGQVETGNPLLLQFDPELESKAALGANWTTITTWRLKKRRDEEDVLYTLIPQYVDEIRKVLPLSGAGWGRVVRGDDMQIVTMYGTEDGGEHWAPLHSPRSQPGVYAAFKELTSRLDFDVKWVNLREK